MRRTTILADPEVLTNMEELARRDGVPTSHVIREAMERYLVTRRAESSADLPALVGMFEGAGDVAERDEEILRAEMPAAADAGAVEAGAAEAGAVEALAAGQLPVRPRRRSRR